MLLKVSLLAALLGCCLAQNGKLWCTLVEMLFVHTLAMPSSARLLVETKVLLVPNGLLELFPVPRLEFPCYLPD